MTVNSAGASLPALALQEVSATYPAHGEARKDVPLSGVTLDVQPGDFMTVLGPNGAGKSTLLRVMSGTLRPRDGRVLLFGEDVATLDRRRVAQRVAVVAQVSTVAFGFSVHDVVLMGRAPHQEGWMLATDEDFAVVEDCLRRCDLVHLAKRRVEELSGGEQKRVAIARALAQHPRVLLLDEPAAFLDLRHQVELCDLLAYEVERAKIACIVVMHDLTLAAQYATRVALLKEGRLLAEGTVEDVMTYRRLKDVFEVDLYVGINEVDGTRYYLPMRTAR